MVAKGSFNDSKRVHNAGLTIDARTASKEPLIAGSYSGNNFPFKFDMAEKAANGPGVPTFDGTAAIKAKLTADSDFSFSIGGSLAMSPLSVTAKEITPEFANRIYSNALSTVKSMNVKADVGFSESKGVDLNISTDIDKILSNAFRKVAADELATVKAEATAKLTEELNKYTAGFTEQYGQFGDIAAKLKDSKSATETLNKELDAKKAELQKKLTGAATSAATDAATKALGNSSAGKAASDAASKLLKGFGR